MCLLTLCPRSLTHARALSKTFSPTYSFSCPITNLVTHPLALSLRPTRFKLRRIIISRNALLHPHSLSKDTPVRYQSSARAKYTKPDDGTTPTPDTGQHEQNRQAMGLAIHTRVRVFLSTQSAAKYHGGSSSTSLNVQDCPEGFSKTLR